jgi:hypothetical protein
MGASFRLKVKCLTGVKGISTLTVRFHGLKVREKRSSCPAEQFNKEKQ